MCMLPVPLQVSKDEGWEKRIREEELTTRSLSLTSSTKLIAVSLRQVRPRVSKKV